MALKRISCLLTTLRDESAFRRSWMRGVAPGPCPGACRPHPWLTVGKVALFEACFVRLNLYKYSYYFQLWLLSSLLVSVKVVKYSCCFYSLSCFLSPVFLHPPKPNQRQRGHLLPPPKAGRASAHASPPPPSPKSLMPMSSVHFGVLAAAPPSRVVNMVNKQHESAEVCGEDDSRGPPRQRMEK